MGNLVLALAILVGAPQVDHVQRAQDLLGGAPLGRLESCSDTGAKHTCVFENFTLGFRPDGVVKTVRNRKPATGERVLSDNQALESGRRFLDRIAPEGYMPRIELDKPNGDTCEGSVTWVVKANPEVTSYLIFNDSITISKVNGELLSFQSFGRKLPAVDPERLRNFKPDQQLSQLTWQIVSQCSVLKSHIRWGESKIYSVPDLTGGKHVMTEKHIADVAAGKGSVFYVVFLVGLDAQNDLLVEQASVDAFTGQPAAWHTVNLGVATFNPNKDRRIPEPTGKWSAKRGGKPSALKASTKAPAETKKATLWNGKQAVPVEFDGKQGLVRWPDGQVFEVPAQLSRDLQKVKPLKIRWSEPKLEGRGLRANNQRLSCGPRFTVE